MSVRADPVASAVASRQEAERLLAGLSGAMAELEQALETETTLIEAGRLREGLAGEARKAELSAAYVLKLQHAKANVVALARLAPDALRQVRGRQAAFERIMDRNQTVIATARAVSEGLIRGFAEAVEREARPQVYGMPSRRPAPTPAASPVVFSGRF